MSRTAYVTDLKSLQGECTANYLRLTRLLGELEAGETREVELLRGERRFGALCIDVLEHAPYTTIAQVSQRGVLDELIDTPRMRVHLYHDVRMAEVARAYGTGTLSLRVPAPALWSPGSPALYDLELTAGADRVRSYFGIREVGRSKDAAGHWRLTLNGAPIFHWGTLDQGWWPRLRSRWPVVHRQTRRSARRWHGSAPPQMLLGRIPTSRGCGCGADPGPRRRCLRSWPSRRTKPALRPWPWGHCRHGAPVEARACPLPLFADRPSG